MFGQDEFTSMKFAQYGQDQFCTQVFASFSPLIEFKDVRGHCYCASLVRTLFIRYALSRHVFQARAPSRNSTKHRADDLCVNLVCEYFCWMLGDLHFFFGRSLPFLILSVILKNKKICTWKDLIISHFTIHIRSNLFMDTGVRDLEVSKQ